MGDKFDRVSTPTIASMRRDWILAWVVMVGFVGVGGIYVAQSRVVDPAPLIVHAQASAADIRAANLVIGTNAPLTTDPYRGLGTWVDVFDYSPPYAGQFPAVDPSTVSEMADAKISTVYLQAARLDDRSPTGLEDRWLLADFLLSSHNHGIAVVAWYLPRFGDDSLDLDRVGWLADFEVLGHRFDGVALDIEWTGDGIDHETRSSRLVDLSRRIAAAHPDLPVGAIVPPPVQMEVVNTAFWPDFPWRQIEPFYDVWLPMSYWSLRLDSSGYGDGYTYHEESVRRLRANLGDPEALVHGIGGIGGVDGIDDASNPREPLAILPEVENFGRALRDTGSIGGSLYDWATMDAAGRAALSDLLAP